MTSWFRNGAYEINDSTLLSKPVILITNGSLNIETRSQEVLEKFTYIHANGSVSYPDDITEKLPIIKVNGSIESLSRGCHQAWQQFDPG